MNTVLPFKTDVKDITWENQDLFDYATIRWGIHVVTHADAFGQLTIHVYDITMKSNDGKRVYEMPLAHYDIKEIIDHDVFKEDSFMPTAIVIHGAREMQINFG